jgi:hypothetical protein
MADPPVSQSYPGQGLLLLMVSVFSTRSRNSQLVLLPSACVEQKR